MNHLRHPGRMRVYLLLVSGAFLLFTSVAWAVVDGSYITTEKEKGSFPLSVDGKSAPLVVSSSDFAGVIRVARDLQTDIGRVTGTEPKLVMDSNPSSDPAVLIGTLGKSAIIDGLVRSGKLDASGIAGKWETFILQVVENPSPGLDRALVIAGSDKRGTIYGIYDLCEQIGVSPWNWWADVPVEHRKNLYVLPGRHTSGTPKVKYRGIFINDEAPALSGWVYEKIGGFDHVFYEKVFELILRMKGNYLWPAMWGKTFNLEDTLNPKLADEYGVVMGTSHHEPMMRAQQEWTMLGKGEWNYQHNEDFLKSFWAQGIRNMGSHESIVTIGMRGDGDMPMSEESNIALLEKIVADQRTILGEITGKDPASIPQIWALYKEVQDYYDKGMRVPDDVTLLLCDDNWGNIRRLPIPGDPPRAGGYGIYYHFDFVGGPRNYKWLNTNLIPRVWEQMHLAYEHGVDRIWIVNVGDIKPMEYPIEFFLDYAWNPDRWTAERLPEYARLWAEQQFGKKHGPAIAEILTKYTQFNARRTPEMLAPDTYSLVNYHEAETVVSEYKALAEETERIGRDLPQEFQDAYEQLVSFPVKACANLNDLYVTAGRNRLYAMQGRASTNGLAERAKTLYAKDAELTDHYNRVMAGGKWNHMMDQIHIGYTIWQEPRANVIPETQTIDIPDVAEMGVSIEGSESWWPMDKGEAVLPEFDSFNRQTRTIDVFNRGRAAFDYTIQCGVPWMRFSVQTGHVQLEQRVEVSVDWKNSPKGLHHPTVTVTGPNGSVLIQTTVRNPSSPKRDRVNGFVENDGVVSMEAAHFTQAVNGPSVQWRLIPDIGRTLSGVTPFPVTAPSRTPEGKSPRLEFQMTVFDSGQAEVHAWFSPTQNFAAGKGLRYAVSIDEGPIQTINVHANDTIPDWKYPQWWNQAVSDHIKKTVSSHVIDKPGRHVLKFWMVDPGLVLQKLVVDLGGMKPSYLGPPESFYRKKGD